MIRKLLLPALCVGLLGGCVSYGYSDGGYYYGRPSAYGSRSDYYGGVGYGYASPYSYSRYYGGYGYPYGYGYGGYYGGGYPYYYRRPVVVVPRGHYPGDGHDHRNDDRPDSGNLPSWRDLSRRAKPDAGQPVMSGGQRPERARIEMPRPPVERYERPASRPDRGRMSLPDRVHEAPERDERLDRKR